MTTQAKLKINLFQGVTYSFAETMQRNTAIKVAKTGKPMLLFFEFEPIITAGLGIKPKDISGEIKKENHQKYSLPLLRIRRGGRLTIHGPGQLVCFPILPYIQFGKTLQDVLSFQEKWIRIWLRTYTIHSSTRDHLTGIWIKKVLESNRNNKETKTENKKICAIGIGSQKGITQHGFSINFNIEPGLFECIIPCGNREDGIINLSNLLEKNSKKSMPSMGKASLELQQIFSKLWLKWISP